ncbi:hypothetical protein V8G54_013782 [Vigna mungo]|uniref:Uncharacterized protein n=1 Tax=Vigna mungo TaxID=3915 RepID=A0AAQ3NGH8_VIGMU
MRSGAGFIQCCLPYLSLSFTERNKFCKVFPISYSFLCQFLNNCPSLWIIKKSERSTVWTKEVPDRFIINLNCRKLQNEFSFRVHLYVLKNICYCVFSYATHGVCLPAACLSICKNA